jgi:hypothetical protein
MSLMKRILSAAMAVSMCVVVVAKDPDGRLATVRKAFVVPIDDLAADRPVAACLAEHLANHLPIEAVKERGDADVVFRVKANIPGATTRAMMGGMGGSPSADLFAELPDGTKLWNDGAKLRRALGKSGKLNSSDGVKGIECGLADELLDTLRDAMRQARDSKKK